MPPSPLAHRAKSHFFNELDLSQVLKAEDENGISGTKVIATIGPACHSVPALVELLTSGAVGARVDLTWGPLDFHRSSLQNLQAAMKDARRLCCTIVDTLGRELMIRRQIKIDEQGWPVHEESFTVEPGQQVVITTRPDAVASNTTLPITYDRFTDMTEPGDTIYIGRYLVCGADSASLYLEVQDVRGPDVVCIAKNAAVLDGLLTVFHVERSADAASAVNIQNTLPLLSDYDKEAIKSLSSDFELDFISLSYVRNEEDIHEARAFLSSIGAATTKVLAKVETRQALLNSEGIIGAADGIIISRGNLGLDCAPEKMAMIQKTLIQACNLAGKPVLITRVVDTMVDMPRPTRAEATDVANAVLDGLDGILLGAETLRGKFPTVAVSTICRICRAAERVFDHQNHYERLMEHALEDEEERALAAMMAQANANGNAEYFGSPGLLGPVGASMTDNGAAGNNDTSVTDGLLRTSPDGSTAELSQVATMTTPGSRLGGPPRVSSSIAFQPTSQQQQQQQQQPLSGKKPSNVFSNGRMSRLAKVGTIGGGLSLASNLDNKASSSMTALSGMFGRNRTTAHGPWRSPFLSKLESIASSAVRVADKIAASLLLVYTHTGATAQLVAKYRPPMPILTLVVPNLTSNGLTWQLQGRGYARQCLLSRGLLPVLANPSAQGEEGLNEAVEFAANLGIVKPYDHIVVVERTHEDFCVKVVSVDQLGLGIRKTQRLRDTGLLSPTRYGPKAAPFSAPFAHSPSMLHHAMSVTLNTYPGGPAAVEKMLQQM